MDFEVSIDELFAYVGKLYIEFEQAKKAIVIKDREIAKLTEEASRSEKQSRGKKVS